MARMLVVLAVLAVVCIGVQATSVTLFPPIPPRDCVDHCPDPTGPHGTYVCCDKHPGTCPPVRDACTAHRGPVGQPRRCTFDPECFADEKCCEDACIPYKVCKPTREHR